MEKFTYLRITVLLNRLNALKLTKYTPGKRDTWEPKARKLIEKINKYFPKENRSMETDRRGYFYSGECSTLKIKIVNGVFTIPNLAYVEQRKAA